MKLNYSLQTVDERIEFVNNFLQNASPEERTNQVLTFLGDYLLFISDKHQTQKEKAEESPITTRNREATIKKRQVSYEELVSTLENGEDGIYNLIRQDKHQLLEKKTKLTLEEVEDIPELNQYVEVLQSLTRQFHASDNGGIRYALKKQIIETWQQIYILKSSLLDGPVRGRASSQAKAMIYMQLDENIWLDEDDMPQSDSILTLINPAHVSFLLNYYSQLSQECREHLDSDMHYLLMDLENLVDEELKENYPIMYDLLVLKIDGYTNEEIQQIMFEKHGIEHYPTYYSTIWKKKIPSIIADAAKRQYLIWYYTNVEYGSWKQCSKCGKIKLAHKLFFAKNSSKDGWYSMCKECKNGRS